MEAFIAKHLTCVICQDEYEDPRRLTCQHVFCLKCLEGHIKVTVGDRYIRGGTVMIVGFNCPECRKVMRIPRPREPRGQWGDQINKDYKTSNIQADIKAGVFRLVDDKVQPEQTKESCSETTRTSAPVEAPPGRVQPAEPVPERAAETKPDPKPKKITPLKGELVKSIPPFNDVRPFDLTVLNQDNRRIIVFLDVEASKIATVVLTDEMEANDPKPVDLGARPWRLCRVSHSEVAVTVSEPEGVMMCNINDRVTTERLFCTSRHYDGIAYLPDNQLVLTGEDAVHIFDMSGNILKELKVSTPYVKYPDISYVTCLPNSNIVVTDCNGKSVTCVNRDGTVLWNKKMNPLGVACDPEGRIYVVDNDPSAHAVLLMSSKGRSVSRVVEKSDQLKKPSALAVDGTGCMYVICNSREITVWKLEPVKPSRE